MESQNDKPALDLDTMIYVWNSLANRLSNLQGCAKMLANGKTHFTYDPTISVVDVIVRDADDLMFKMRELFTLAQSHGNEEK